MGWFNRSSDSSSESSSKPDVTDAQLREIGRLVNEGRSLGFGTEEVRHTR